MAKLSPLALLFALAVPLAAQGQDRRCRTIRHLDVIPPLMAAPSDCGYWTNVPEPEYHPDAGCLYEITVVFHVIQHTNGDGFVDAATLQDQIDVLNEDFLALPGTPGGQGNNAKIRFRIATVDPDGNPTTGITYSTDDRWFDDRGNYNDVLNWDSNRYMNIYTNDAPGFYGYVNGFAAAGGLVGTTDDFVVINYKTVGREPTDWWDGNMGRTGTHEIGHYVGLYHTFDSGCGDAMDCYRTSDLICDTNPQANATDWCDTPSESCGSPDPIDNYMDYTADICLFEFTPEQVLRARCTLEHWRPDVWTAICAESNCADGIDDDGDYDVDCDDEDCASIPPCAPAVEDCANGMDDDGDGDIDCEDLDCFGTPACGESVCDLDDDGIADGPDACCSNGADDDGDGNVDCEDSDCFDSLACGESVCDLDEDGIADGPDACCGNGADDDGDGDVDCDDADCALTLPCTPEDCSNGADDDGDGDVDCDDSECFGTLACGETVCDEDGDGDADGADSCCSNGGDDDGDGLIDCEDPDCLIDDLGDCDRDGTPNGEDCQPGNPLVGPPPVEVGRLDVANPGAGDAELRWSSVAEATGYDILSGVLSELWAAGTGTDTGSCAPGGSGAFPPFVDTRRPSPAGADGQWYVVRALNPCPGTYGFESNSNERPLPVASDCP